MGWVAIHLRKCFLSQPDMPWINQSLHIIHVSAKNIIHTSAKKYNAYICKKIEYIYLQNTKEHKSAIFVWIVFQRESETPFDLFLSPCLLKEDNLLLSLQRRHFVIFSWKGDNLLLLSLEKGDNLLFSPEKETICYFLLKRRQFVMCSLKGDNLLFSSEKREK